MHALLLKAPQELSYEEVPVPTPGPGDLLIKVKATTTCGTDLKAFRRGHPMIPMPGPLGHEYSGVVVAAGEGAKFKVGDAIMGVHSAPCQTCYWCQHGQENLCETIMATMVLGSYAEYLLIPKRIADLNVFDKPDSISFEMASLLEPLACVAQGVSKLPLTPDSSVLVIGPGAIGLMFVAALKAVGVEDVTLAGRNAGRLAVGESLGAKTSCRVHRASRSLGVVRQLLSPGWHGDAIRGMPFWYPRQLRYCASALRSSHPSQSIPLWDRRRQNVTRLVAEFEYGFESDHLGRAKVRRRQGRFRGSGG